MKITLTLITIVASLFLGACANNNHNNRVNYWDARRAAIAALPPNQRAQAQIDLMRDQYADHQMRRQALSNSLNQINSDMNAMNAMNTARIQSMNQPGSFGNPVYVRPVPSFNPPPVPVLTGY
jgi:hypothetical protein